MTATKSTFRFQTLARVLMPLLVVSTTVVHGQTPAQLPLLTKAGAAVPPNVMLTLDDSGSMAFRHMPENKFAADTFVTDNPVASNRPIAGWPIRGNSPPAERPSRARNANCWTSRLSACLSSTGR